MRIDVKTRPSLVPASPTRGASVSDSHHYVVPRVTEVPTPSDEDEADRTARRAQVEVALRDRAKRLAGEQEEYPPWTSA
jgi:hypothetical protein